MVIVRVMKLVDKVYIRQLSSMYFPLPFKYLLVGNIKPNKCGLKEIVIFCTIYVAQYTEVVLVSVKMTACH